MKKASFFAFLLGGIVAVSSCNKSASDSEEAKKIVSLNGAITETISALGNEADIVGVDVTSTFPESVKTTAQDLGHIRSITLEPLLALQPTVIIATDGSLNPDLHQKTLDAGVDLVLLKEDYSIEGAKELIYRVAQVLGKKDTKTLTGKIDADIAQIKTFETRPKVLFIYARGAGTLQVAGEKTAFEEMIKIAGGENAAKGFEDFKPLTAEALVESNPDVLLLFTSGIGSLGGVDGLLAVPGIAQTNAGKNKAVIALDGGLLSNFGPRVGQAALLLNQELAKFAK